MQKRKFLSRVFTLLLALSLIGCINENAEENYPRDLRERTIRLALQNKKAQDNLDNLYMFFDRAKILNPKIYRANWNQAFELKRASEILLNDIDTLKNSLGEIPTITPSKLKEKVTEFEQIITALPDTMNPMTTELTLDLTGLIGETWGQNQEMVYHDMTIMQNAIINVENAILMEVYHILRKKEEKNKTGS
ncbi:MAG: hypothetical protein COA57_09605 [Flavobacteriales bacterium]|nr:MAG: hypothetical protein COA57_09605 [Flavobacteriales bacterium]